jgi:hypothetical protein
MSGMHHPIMRLIAKYTYVEPLRDDRMLTEHTGSVMPAIMYMPFARAGAVRTMMAVDISAQFIGDQVRLTLPSIIDRSLASLFVEDLLHARNDNLWPRYTVGLERCVCPPEIGGPRWNPSCIVIGWNEQMSTQTRTNLGIEWYGFIRKRPELFCANSISILRALGLL